MEGSPSVHTKSSHSHESEEQTFSTWDEMHEWLGKKISEGYVLMPYNYYSIRNDEQLKETDEWATSLAKNAGISYERCD